MNKENKTNDSTVSYLDEVAVYSLLRDVYLLKHKVRSWLFRKILAHMIDKIAEESTIFFLMEEIRANRKVSL